MAKKRNTESTNELLKREIPRAIQTNFRRHPPLNQTKRSRRVKDIKKDGEVVAVSMKEFVYVAKYVAAATKRGARFNTLLREIREWGQSLPRLPETSGRSRFGIARRR